MDESFLNSPILAIDPGKRSGWASLSSLGFMSGEKNFDDIGLKIQEECAKFQYSALRVVSERFVITIHTGKNTQAPWSLKVNGVAEFIARIQHGLTYVEQSASEAKTFSGDEKLKALGWYTPGMPHANDAARHLLLYGVSRKLFWDERLRQFF